jgi:hypothetical protein
VLTQKAIIAGERRLKAFFVLQGWYIDEWGDLVKDEPIVSYEEPPMFDPTEAHVPDVEQKHDHMASVRQAQAEEPKEPTI